MQIHQSAEDYLEKILMLNERLGYARSVDIANELKVTKPSVSVAMKRLRENNYIEMDRDGHITLLPAGRAIAERIYDRHKVLSAFLRELGVSDETAAEDACKVEHVLSEESFSAVCRFVHKSL
ncbi:MAG: metal-dependent transcriptional regulator [Pyramidobacter sp.]|nr:metal-dependent transcriptional regulator [Pyramidobacter sp.]MBP3752609.1 metal-dependent transcriptional regulator [Pyramidobacter sp.]MBP3836811.1 metal-dependent transcriptional regulator [Pyramidobacter sp.]MBQ4491638.1 metal-dependent transcriptional regulator [Pyramidobacter sp.]MBQ8090499.1 metal-dependent transcriptional regulator [Pyramidobacter sp.]